MPGDNAATIGVGTDIDFPQDGPTNGLDIIRTSSNQFTLVSIGIYSILFQASIDEAAQLVVSLNNIELDYTTVGRATGTSQLVGICSIETFAQNSILTIRNPASNTTALTLTPFAGGSKSVSANLSITRIF
jgi:hypothetical protein